MAFFASQRRRQGVLIGLVAITAKAPIRRASVPLLEPRRKKPRGLFRATRGLLAKLTLGVFGCQFGEESPMNLIPRGLYHVPHDDATSFFSLAKEPASLVNSPIALSSDWKDQPEVPQVEEDG
jgi:hypothetical protein